MSEEYGDLQVELTRSEIVGYPPRDAFDIVDPQVGDDVAEVEQVEDLDAYLHVVDEAEKTHMLELLKLR